MPIRFAPTTMISVEPGILVREVFDDEQRDRLVEQVAGSLLGGVREPVLSRAFQYWKNIDLEVGHRIEDKVRSRSGAEPAEGMGEGSAPAGESRASPRRNGKRRWRALTQPSHLHPGASNRHAVRADDIRR